MAKAKKDADKVKSELQDAPQLWIGSSKHFWPFSRGLVTRSLLHAGAGRKEAAAIARSVEQELHEKDLSPIKSSDLQELLVKITKKASGGSLAKVVARQTPFFKDMQIETENGKTPFSRAVLARRLDDIGLDIKEAFSVARLVDLELRAEGHTTLEIAELRRVVLRVLEQEYGRHFARNYQFSLEHQGRIGVVGSGGSGAEDSGEQAEVPIPFSKGILMQSLLAAGTPPEAARTLARTVQNALRGSEDTVVTRAQIRAEVQSRLRDVAGRHVSARYMLLRSIRHLNRPLVVLIGGVSGTGKSALASEVAYRLGIPRVVNTDSVREVMRAMVSRELTPTLHTSTFLAWQSLLIPGEKQPKPVAPELLQAGFREQAREVWVGVNAVLRRTIHENVDVVAEGVHLAPIFIEPALREQAIIVPVLLVTPDEKEHRNRFLRREQETHKARPESHYLQHFAEIRGLQEYLLELAEQKDISTLAHTALDELADHLVDTVLARVTHDLRQSGALPELLAGDDEERPERAGEEKELAGAPDDELELDLLEYVGLLRDMGVRPATDDADDVGADEDGKNRQK